MVWGCFSGAGLVPLVPMKGTLNASTYQEMLDNSMLPTVWEQFGDGNYFAFLLSRNDLPAAYVQVVTFVMDMCPSLW